MTLEQMQNSLYLLAFLLLSYGAYSDWKTRKFPNWIFLLTFIVGLFYCWIAEQIGQGMLGFILLNCIGLFFHKYHLVAPGDMKYISLVFLFVNMFDGIKVLIYVIALVVWSLFLGFIYYYHQNKKMGEEFKKGFRDMFLFFTMRVPMPQVNLEGNVEEIRERTFPLTLPMYFAFVTISIYTYFVF